MKYLSAILLAFIFIFGLSASAQISSNKNFSSYFQKGTKTAGIELCIAGDYNTVLELDISKNYKDLGLLILPS